MTQPLNFQEIILKLQHFWADHGCLIWQPYYTQVGAGTYNPATFLRVLGPEPWNVAYVEPSIRPDDGRYGENPNRMQQHYQFQVILKPDPGNPQELYLQSLEALGIDPRQHDIRFVEDNWESPALGAWGLGWEVWLDGQEITQFTYFQQAGGIVLDPVSVELTYGLERIAIALQRVSSFRDIQWSPTLTDGDVNLQAEQEHSRYYFEIADVERLRQMYDVYEAEARACLENGLVLPAHDYVLRCSHTFNVLDTRGAIGVTERAAFFGRMRSLSRRVAEAYLEQRQRMEFPWLKEAVENPRLQVGGSSTPMNPSHQQENLKPVTAVRRSELPQATETFNRQTEQPSTFLLEVGTEELPAGDLDSALEQLRQRVPVLFAELRLRHGLVNIQGTPRRLVVSVEAVAPVQLDLEQVFKGPPAGRAIGPDGSPTPAAEGFARSRGVAVSDLQVRELEGGRYVTAVVKQAGQPAGIVLANALPELLAGLRFDKSMRWNSSNVSFSRPVRWLLALYGDQVVPFEWARLRAGRITRGLRFQQPEVMEIENPASYFKLMREAGIWLSRIERQAVIHDQVEALASQVQGRVSPDPKLLSEIANLVESPAALRGAFDPSHLQLPRPVLTSVMKKHQRYFPVEIISGNQAQAPAGTGGEGEGTLLPYFITVANKPTQGLETADDYPLVVEGNEHVIGARFADANFFVREDVKQPLEAYLPRLATLTFQVKLGSMLDKTRRVVALVEDLSSRLGLEAGETASARRAAELCKADLATNMVVEMTSLQGVMGRIYALLSGEPQAVADAIYEHYLPRFTGDAVPKDRPGLVVGLADRLDTLSGLFAAGFAPSGNKDPFAQRRAALGLVQNLIAWDLDFDLQNGLALATGHLPVLASSQSQADCLTFITERLRNILLELSNRYDVVDAVVTAQGNNPAGAARSAIALSEWVSRPDWHTILPAYARCVRITRDFNERFPVNPEDFTDPEERELFVAIEKAEAAPRQPGSVDDFLNAFLPMIPAINRFFDKVLVMAEDDRQRENRLGLLQRIAALAGGVADMGKLEGF